MKFMQRGRRLTTSLLATLTVIAAGCDGLLDENPVSTITPVNFYQTPQDALTAVAAVYSTMRYVGNYPGWNYLIENLTAQSLNRRNGNDGSGCWDVFMCQTSNAIPSNMWSRLYEGINRANAVVGNVPGIEDMDPANQARIIAEARFLRASHYFTLVRLFGGVPLFQEETTRLDNLIKPRTSADEIYTFIISDLEAAVADLPVTVPADEFGRATQGAARTLLGKVYLQRGVIGQSNPFGDPLLWPTAQAGDLDAALAQFRAVVNSGQYALVDDYASLWEVGTEINPEVIFSIRYAPFDGEGAQSCTYASPLFSNFCARQFASWWGEVPFYESYAEGDVRREATWISEFIDPNGVHRLLDPEDVLSDNYGREGPAARKYIGDVRSVAIVGAEPIDFVYLRFGDVLLMLAEVLWRQNPGSGEALELVNQVRERAGVSPLSVLTEEALYWERQWELATEQHGWFDAPRFWDLHLDHMVDNAMLRQTNPAKYDRGRPVPEEIPLVADQPKIRLIPIPQGAIDLNRELVQNPGY
jgi:starch-binding outer membrane protein, SusD/RagB family